MKHIAQRGKIILPVPHCPALPYQPPNTTGTPVGAVRMQLSGMGTGIEELAASIGTLRERLDPVLKAGPPSVGETDGQRCCVCSVADDIRAKADQIADLNSIVQSLIERLDV